MSTVRKLSHDYLTQIVAFAVAILDRLVIPGIILRTLGVDNFAGWTVAMALAGLIPALDLGATRYFANSLLRACTRADDQHAVRLFRQASLIISGLALVAALMLGGYALIVGLQSGRADIDVRLGPIAMLFIGGLAIQQVMAVRQALYRAHHEFARETMIRSICELLRIGAMVAAVVAGATLEQLALTWFIAIGVGTAIPFAFDSWRRFPAYREGPVGMDVGERRAFLMHAPGFWLQALLTTLIATVPVLLIGYWTVSALLVAQFGLMRTIANLVRQILQLFANVFGLELGRRLAREDHAGFAEVFVQSTRLLGVQAGVAAAALLMAGPLLFELWTGQADLYDPMMMALAILTPILVPTLFLATEASAYAGHVWHVVAYRAAQLALTLALLQIVPIDNIALRMMVALAAGEMLAVALPMLAAMRRINAALPIARQMQAALWTLASMALTAAIMMPTLFAGGQPFAVQAAIALITGGIAFAVATLTLGLTGARRAQLITAMRVRIGGA